MTSARIPWKLETNALTRAIDARRASGASILDLTESNPTRAGFDYAADQIATAFGDPRSLLYEPDPRGQRQAREAIARYYQDSLEVAVDPDRILLTASTSEAYSFLFKLLADPGDSVLIPHPSYPLFDLLAALETVRLDPYGLGYDGRWYLDIEALEAALTESTRAVIVVNPNNPTGSYLKRGEFEALIELCRRNDLAIISDEVFADYAFEADSDRVRTVAGDHGVLTFALSGLSKVAGLPQMKLGWIVTSGPKHLRAPAEQRLEIIADTFLSVSTPVQHAAPALLETRHRLQRAIVERTGRNRAFAMQALARETNGACSALHVEGGWNLVLRVPSVQSEEAWVLELLERDGVLVHPGYYFDFATEAYLVVSLLTAEGVFQSGIERLIARVRAHTDGLSEGLNEGVTQGLREGLTPPGGLTPRS